MTGLEREMAAIRHELPDRVPTDAICVEPVAELAAFLGIAVEQVADRLGLDGRIVAPSYVGATRQTPDGLSVSDWGALPALDYGTAHWYPLARADSVDDVERHPWPDPDQYDYAAAAATAGALGDTYAVRGPYWLPVFCRVCELAGLETALTWLAADPVLFEAAMGAICERVEAICAALLDACGDAMPILCLGDDFATQRGLMMSPAHWRRYLKPHYARLFDVAKRRGKAVWFHSCGDVTPVLPDLIDLGVDVWETVQLHALPLSPSELKTTYGGHLTFFGGVNTQRLPFTSPAEVATEVAECIRVLGEGGGYICGPDHHIKPDVSPGTAVALFDAARAYRNARCTRDDE